MSENANHNTSMIAVLEAVASRREFVPVLLFGFQLLADTAQFNKVQCGHRAKHRCKHNKNNRVHWTRAPLKQMVNVVHPCCRSIVRHAYQSEESLDTECKI